MSSIAINRMVAVLNCFSSEEPLLSFTEISQRLNLPKGSAHRLLQVLESNGLLTRSAGGRGYQLGYQLIRWGMLARSASDLRNIALPALRALSQACGETSFLLVREGNAGICLERVETSQPMRVALRVGERQMLHAGAGAKVLLAFLPEADIRRVLAEIELVPLQPRTITERETLWAELAAIRARGYATSFEETALGTMAIAAPVSDSQDRLVAAIGIEAPLTRIPPEQVKAVAPLVVQAAKQVSAQLGHDSRTAKRPA
jgi:DNA-binding IclR family transcriptional regulator